MKIPKNNSAARETYVFLVRVMLIHTITYFLSGSLAAIILDYRTILNSPIIRDFMIGFGSASVFWGPFAQPIRGIILGLVLLPFRTFLSQEKHGWLYLWLIFIGVGILSTPAAAPSSIEGIVYSRLPLWYHLIGLPEMLVQTLAFSIITHLYLRHPSGILSSLPKSFERFLQALAGSCFAFIGYGVVSILYALIQKADINTGENLSLKVQGLFLAPFLCNLVIILMLGSNEGFRKMKLFIRFAAIWAINGASIGLYQAVFWGGADFGYMLIAPILPTIIIIAMLRRNTGLATVESRGPIG